MSVIKLSEFYVTPFCFISNNVLYIKILQISCDINNYFNTIFFLNAVFKFHFVQNR